MATTTASKAGKADITGADVEAQIAQVRDDISTLAKSDRAGYSL